MGSHSLLQGVFPTQGLNPGLLHCRQILSHLSHQKSPRENTGCCIQYLCIFTVLGSSVSGPFTSAYDARANEWMSGQANERMSEHTCESSVRVSSQVGERGSSSLFRSQRGVLRCHKKGPPLSTDHSANSPRILYHDLLSPCLKTTHQQELRHSCSPPSPLHRAKCLSCRRS